MSLINERKRARNRAEDEKGGRWRWFLKADGMKLHKQSNGRQKGIH